MIETLRDSKKHHRDAKMASTIFGIGAIGATCAAIGIKLGFFPSEPWGAKGYAWWSVGLGLGGFGFFLRANATRSVAKHLEFCRIGDAYYDLYTNVQAITFLDSQTKNKI